MPSWAFYGNERRLGPGPASAGAASEVIDPANLLVSPEDFTTWNAFGAVITTDDTANPNGVVNADKFDVGGIGGGTAIGVYQPFTFSAVNYRFVCRFKRVNWDFVVLDFNNGADKGAVFNINAGTVPFSDSGVTAAIVPLSNGWFRCSIERAMSAGGQFPEIYFAGSGASNDRTRSTGSPTTSDAFWAWGATLVTA